jgi:hypothetical protein
MFELKLSLQEVNAVLAALGKGTFDQVAGIIGNIRAQAEPQLARVQQEIAAAEAAQKAAEANQEATA